MHMAFKNNSLAFMISLVGGVSQALAQPQPVESSTVNLGTTVLAKSNEANFNMGIGLHYVILNLAIGGAWSGKKEPV